MTDPKQKRKKLYETLVNQQAFTGSQEDFESKFSDESRISKLYEGLRKQNAFNGSAEEFTDKFFSDIVKKKDIPSWSQQMQQVAAGYGTSTTSSQESNVPTAESKTHNQYGSIASQIDRARKAAPAKEKIKQDEDKRKRIEYFDKVSPFLERGLDARAVYKNWTAENGTLDRYNYLEQKAQSEAEQKRGELGFAVGTINNLQEERRKAAVAGDMDEYSRLNDLIQSGAEYLRANKAGANADYKTNPRTDTGLQIWEESIGFTAQMLNDKVESLLSNPQTKQKLDRLSSLGAQLKKSDEELKANQDPVRVQDHNRLINEYNSLLAEPDITEVNKVSKYGQSLVDSEKELATNFPDVFQKRLEKASNQQVIDKVFKNSGGNGVAYGVLNQIGRSATGLVADLAKLPAIVDYDNKYGWQDKWSGLVDTVADYVNDAALPVPSDYNKPLVYKDDKGNTVWRNDLIIPKVAKVAGDMASLLYGAGKISALSKATGVSSKVSNGIGLFSSSYLQSFDDYKKSGINAGMSPKEAALFATAAAGTTSALELISPNKFLWAKNSDEIAKRVVSNVAKGMTVQQGLKESIKSTLKEIGGENIQEISQQIGDIVVESGANQLAGNNYFDHNSTDIMNEALETMVLTTIVTGAPALAASAAQFMNHETNYRDAVKLVAENKEKYLPLLQAAFKSSNTDPVLVQKVMNDINNVGTPLSGAPLYKVNDQTVPRNVIEEQLESGDLEGVYVANDPQLEQQLKESLEDISNVSNVTLPFLEGIPKIGRQKQLDSLVESGDVAIEDNRITAKTTKGAVALKRMITNSAHNLKGIAKMAALNLKGEEKDKEQAEESPEDKAKRIAKAKIEVLVQSGDLQYDGKRAKVLTEKGGQALYSILDKMNRSIGSPVDVKRSQNEPVQEARTEKKSEQAEEVKIPDQITETDLNELAKTPEHERIANVLTKAKASLSSLNPSTKVVAYNGKKEGAAILEKLGSKEKLNDNTAGFYNRESGTIGIDLSQADATTAFHESFHPIIDFVKSEKPELFKSLTDEAAAAPLELEDGTTINYGDYSKGDKEEALVDFLSDFADGKFDDINNPKSILEKVKNIINKILESVGLKSSDFNVDLDNIKDLEDFADQMATAISKGKTINLSRKTERKKKSGTAFQNRGAKKKIKKYEEKTGRKVNKTAKRIAFDKATQFKDLAVDIITKPQDYSYDPQKFSDIDQYLESLSDLELLNMVSINNSMGVLAGIKLLRRYNKAGQDTRPIFKKLREIGTSVGQLLRQFGELKTLKGLDPQEIVEMVLGNLESLEVTLKQDQQKELESLADEHVKAVTDKENKRINYQNNPDPTTEKALNDAEQKQAETFEELSKFVELVTPLGLDSMLTTILQGNLLTTKSIVGNPISNLIQQPLRQAELFAGDLATYFVNRRKKINLMNPFEMYFGAAVNGIEQFGSGIPKAIKDAVKGKGAESNATLEMRRNLKPLQAWWQMIAGKATLPVNEKGNVPNRIYMEKFFEGTFGIPAEAFFRMLYIGDKPFKDAGAIAGAYRLYAESGGSSTRNPITNAGFRKFMADLTPEQKDKIKQYAEEATFSDERTLSKIADKFVRGVSQAVDTIAEYTPNDSLKYTLKTIGKVIAKSVTPYVRVPSNLLQYLLELAMPVIPLYGSIHFALKGDQRKSAAMFVRAATGFALMYMADMLYDAGVILASGDDDEEKERQLKHAIGRPNGFNITGYARFRTGGDSEWRMGDKVIDFSKLGLLGMYMAYRAEYNESLQKDLKKSRGETDVSTRFAQQFNSVSGAALEMSFMQGSYNMLKSLDRGEFQNGLAELVNTMSAIIIPNQVSAITRARAPYILRGDDKEVLNSFFQKQSTKLFPSQKDNVAGVYPIIGMFGEPVEQSPNRKAGTINSLMYQFFDITNSEQIDNPLVVEVFNVSKKTNEIPISAPTEKVQINGKETTLTKQDYVYLQMLTGKYKSIILSEQMADPIWKTFTDDEKLTVMKSVNESANKEMKDLMEGKIYDGIEAGRILLNEKTGTYHYVAPSEFDFDFSKDVFRD